MILRLNHISYVLRLVLAFSLTLSFPAFANEGGSAGGDGEGAGAGLSRAVTDELIKILNRGMGECQILREYYRYDCYRLAYRRAAKHLNGRPAYAEALAALEQVEDSLSRVVAQNADPTIKKKRKGFDVYTPIKPAAIPKATAEFEQALDKAETILLRSPENTQVHYARIAEVVHSNKVLLRS
jgi:hypothetical protein